MVVETLLVMYNEFLKFFTEVSWNLTICSRESPTCNAYTKWALFKVSFRSQQEIETKLITNYSYKSRYGGLVLICFILLWLGAAYNY